MTRLTRFVDDDSGAITIDWVTLTMGVLLLGIVIVYAIYNRGVAPSVHLINSTLGEDLAAAEIGQPIDCNTFGSC